VKEEVATATMHCGTPTGGAEKQCPTKLLAAASFSHKKAASSCAAEWRKAFEGVPPLASFAESGKAWGE
jgi:hypothetical protein